MNSIMKKVKSKTFCITLNVTVNVDVSEGGKRIPWISFKGWKNGVVSKANRFIDTEPMVKKTDDNMKKLGQEIFDAAREMFAEDGDLELTEK